MRKSTAQNILNTYDMFGAAVPQFTIEGKTHQGSSIGLLWTIVFYSVILGFSTLKFLELVTHDSP